MCLYPKLIKNKRYLAYVTKKRTWEDIVATCDDPRKLYVPIGCGECYECRRQKAQQWRVRLHEELKVNKYAYFITLTFTNEDLIKLSEEKQTKEYNELATIAVRRFLERWRKEYKKSLKHWLITELGHEGTERIHLHGIIFSEFEISNELLSKFWKYGRTDTGLYCNEQSINYIVKYVTKIDTDHKTFKGKILCSAGIGKNYVDSFAARATHRYKPHETKEYYLLKNGYRVALPIYYRNKLFTHEEREKLWTEKLDKGEIFCNGIRIRHVDTIEGERNYFNVLRTQQEWNKAVGYGDRSKEWKKEDYYIDFEKLKNLRVENRDFLHTDHS